MFDFFSKEDKQLYNMLGHLNMAEKEISLKDNSETEIYEVAGPDDKYAFLHEAAIIEYHGTLFAAWYNCEEKELIGPTIFSFPCKPLSFFSSITVMLSFLIVVVKSLHPISHVPCAILYAIRRIP